MGLLVNPVSVRLGIAHRWYDVVAVTPSIYSTVLHNILTLRRIIMRLTWRAILHIRGITSSHVNVFLYNHYYHVHVYMYDGLMETIYRDFVYTFVSLSQSMYAHERYKVKSRLAFLRKFGFLPGAEDPFGDSLAVKEEFSYTFRIFAFFLSLIKDWTAMSYRRPLSLDRSKYSPENYGLNFMWWSKFRLPKFFRNSLRNRFYLRRDLVSLRLRLSLLKRKRFVFGLSKKRRLKLNSYDERMRARFFKICKLNGLFRRRLAFYICRIYTGLLRKYVSAIDWNEVDDADDLNSIVYGNPRFMLEFRRLRKKIRLFFYYYYFGYYNQLIGINKKLEVLREKIGDSYITKKRRYKLKKEEKKMKKIKILLKRLWLNFFGLELGLNKLKDFKWKIRKRYKSKLKKIDPYSSINVILFRKFKKYGLKVKSKSLNLDRHDKGKPGLFVFSSCGASKFQLEENFKWSYKHKRVRVFPEGFFDSFIIDWWSKIDPILEKVREMNRILKIELNRKQKRSYSSSGNATGSKKFLEHNLNKINGNSKLPDNTQDWWNQYNVKSNRYDKKFFNKYKRNNNEYSSNNKPDNIKVIDNNSNHYYKVNSNNDQHDNKPNNSYNYDNSKKNNNESDNRLTYTDNDNKYRNFKNNSSIDSKRKFRHNERHDEAMGVLKKMKWKLNFRFLKKKKIFNSDNKFDYKVFISIFNHYPKALRRKLERMMRSVTIKKIGSRFSRYTARYFYANRLFYNAIYGLLRRRYTDFKDDLFNSFYDKISLRYLHLRFKAKLNKQKAKEKAKLKKYGKKRLKLGDAPRWLTLKTDLVRDRKWGYFKLLNSVKARMVSLKRVVLKKGRWLTNTWREKVNKVFKGIFFPMWVRLYRSKEFETLWRLYDRSDAGSAIGVVFFEYLKWFCSLGFRLRRFDLRRNWLRTMKFSTYIWMFINYEAYQGGYYFSFRSFYAQHRDTKNLKSNDIFLDLNYLRELDHYLIRFVEYFARNFVWFLYGRFAFFAMKVWLLRRIRPYVLFPVIMKFFFIGNNVITASYIAKFIAFKLERRYGFMELLHPMKREFKRVISSTPYLHGFKIQFAGRKTRRDRSRRMSVQGGALSLSRRAHYVEYSCREVILNNSINSIRVWFYRPYIFTVDLQSMLYV